MKHSIEIVAGKKDKKKEPEKKAEKKPEKKPVVEDEPEEEMDACEAALAAEAPQKDPFAELPKGCGFFFFNFMSL
jgi:hypothetical protein